MSFRFESRSSSHSHSVTRSTPLLPPELRLPPESPQRARTSSKWIFRTGTPLLLFFVGVSALGYCGYVVLDARSSQSEQSREFDRALIAAHAAATANASAATAPVLPSFQDAPVFQESNSAENHPLLPGVPLGRIEIASIGLSAMIEEGTGRQTLQRGVGHITGTALVGKSGNVGLAGHRDTFFRKLRNIHQGDEIALTTLDGSFLYRVDLISIVEPQSSEVLRDSGENLLTLVTCYPFSYVGPSPKRFIVRARQIAAPTPNTAMIQ
jgi:sortase A